MKRAMRIAIVAVFGCSAATFGQNQAPSTADGAAARSAASERVAATPLEQSLDAIHDDLIDLRFEKALSGIETLLGAPGLEGADRARVLVLRAQAHAAFGDLDGVEQDYREILRLLPAYTPESSLTSGKAMRRFEKVRSETIGRLRVTTDPADAKLLLDGMPITVGTESFVPILAGDHVLRAERAGFDAEERTVRVPADKDTGIEIRLVPNARTLVVQTEEEGVEVWLDGVSAGETARADGGPPRVVIELVSAGEHPLKLSKPCFRTEHRRAVVSIDLMDRSPARVGPFPLARADVPLVLRAGPSGADVRIDGRSAGRLPLDDRSLCPGPHELEVFVGTRRVWVSTETLAESREHVVEIRPRPNAVLLGDTWPNALESLRSEFNHVPALRAPRRAPDTAEGWDALELAADVDLVVAAASGGAAHGAVLYSPILRHMAPIDLAAAPEGGKPRWDVPYWGLVTADSRYAGPAVVIAVTPDGPAATAGIEVGSRIVKAGGVGVSSSEQLRSLLERASNRAPLPLEWTTPPGASKQAAVNGGSSIRIEPVRAMDPGRALVRAAWAKVDSATDPEQAPAALANLALLLSEFGRTEPAIDVWKRIRLGDRRGIGDGTIQYLLGRDLERAGKSAEAARAYRAAARSQATVFSDGGPAVAPAAADRLADLGIGEGSPR